MQIKFEYLICWAGDFCMNISIYIGIYMYIKRYKTFFMKQFHYLTKDGLKASVCKSLASEAVDGRD